MAGYSRMVYFEIIQYDRLSLIQYGIMWRNQTKEYSHYLVKFDDGGLLIVPRSRILEEGRIAENGKYKVQYNKPEDVSDAVIIKTGDYLTLSRLKREMGQKKKDEHQKNPSTIPTPKRTLTTSRLPQPKRKKMASVIRRTTLESFSSNDPRDLSISNVSSSSYSTSSTPESVFQASSRIPVPVRVTVPRDVESPSTSEEQSLLQALPDLQDCEITCRQLFRTPNRNRQKTLSAVERYMKTMNKKQHELQLEVKGLRQELKDMNNLVLLILQRLPPHGEGQDQQIPPVPSPQPATQTLPTPETDTSKFGDIPPEFRISAEDLNAMHLHAFNAGHFATKIVQRLFPELTGPDNLRQKYSYFGGGRCNKLELDTRRKSFVVRYVLHHYPQVQEKHAWQERVVVKINEFLRRK